MTTTHSKPKKLSLHKQTLMLLCGPGAPAVDGEDVLYTSGVCRSYIGC
jgi:hypothetical protein